MSEIDPKRKSEMKKVFAPGYLLTNILRSEAHLNHCLNSLQSHLARLADAHEQVHLEDWFHYWSFDSIAGLVFSGSFGFLDSAKDIGGSIANARFFMLYLSVTAHAYWIHDLLLGNPLLKWLGFKPKQHIMDTTQAAADARRRNPEAGHDMLEQWGLALRKTKISGFKEEDLVQNAASTITAGSDTVAATLQSFVYHLLHYPSILAKLTMEVDTAHAAGKLSHPILASEAQNLPYLQAVLKEILRFFPPVPSGLPRKIPPTGLSIGNKHFPPGITISINPHIIHRSPECFAANADQFLPERWLGEDGKRIEKYFIAFGAGYNSCPGRAVAFAELSKAAVMLVREFEFGMVDEGREWRYENRFTVVPYGWPCYVRRRV